MSKLEIKFSNFDFVHLEGSTGPGPKGVPYFLTEDDAVVVDPAGVAFDGRKLNTTLDQSGAGAASGAIYAIAKNRPNVNAGHPAKIKGIVNQDATGIVTKIPLTGAVLNLQNLSPDGKKGALIHAVGPQFEAKKTGETPAAYAARKDRFAKDLKQTFIHILQLWQENADTRDKTLCLPFISGGAFGGHHLGDEYFKIFVEQLEAAMVVAGISADAIGRIKIVPYKPNTQTPIELLFRVREAKKAAIEEMEKGYEEYLAKTLQVNATTREALIAEIEAAEHVVIEQGQHGAARTNQKDLIKRLYANKNFAIGSKQVIALVNGGDGAGGHWEFITPTLDGTTKDVTGFVQTPISGAGLACGAYTVMRILGQVKPSNLDTFVNGLNANVFSAAEINEIRLALSEKKDLTRDGGILARRFVAEIVRTQINADTSVTNKPAIIDAAVRDIMTKQIEQENLRRALKYFNIAVVMQNQITTSAANGANAGALSFEDWVYSAYFGDEGATAKGKRDDLEVAVNSRGADGKAMLTQLKTQFTQARALDISIDEILAQPDKAAREKEEVDNIVATTKLLQKERNEQFASLAQTPAAVSSPSSSPSPSLNNDQITNKVQCDLWYLFPTVNSLKSSLKGNEQLARKALRALAQDKDYAKNYVANVKQYLLACGYDCDAAPPIAPNAAPIEVDKKRFNEVVDSFDQLTAGNRLDLEGISKDNQKALLTHLHDFAKAANLAESAATKKLKKMLEPEKAFTITTVKPDQEGHHSNPIFVKEQKLYMTTSNKAGIKEVEVAGAGVYYNVTVDATTGVSTTRFNTPEDVAHDDTGVAKSWKGDAMDYYLGKTKAIPPTAVQIISAIAVLGSNSRSRS